ncbi:MAG: long-chain fatty acid--CoA ligase [Deltaproteobacteria bacterium]|nr:long-chain fatty acid--CoA ligase [Deltaproteobacteria bacterium]
MILERVRAGALAHPERLLVAAPDGQWSWAAVAAEVDRRVLDAAPLRGETVALQASATAAALLRLIELEARGARVVLLPPEMEPGREAEWMARLGSGPSQPGEVVLFSSGTTGVPKGALHSWDTLSARVHRSAGLDGSRWLLTFALSAFAGLQVVLHALDNGGALVLYHGTPAEGGRTGAEHGVTHLSATPTFYRFLLATSPPEVLASLRPVQITLGGEVADQGVLDALGRSFPQARLTHVYASTEAGAVFSVQDGRAGFPAAWLDSAATPLRIRDGELLVGRARGMKGYLGAHRADDGELLATGDLVEVVGDRVLFRGRRSERIHVGGAKVDPSEVERVLLEVPGVVAVRVSGAPSSLMGQLVRAEVLLAPDRTPAAMRLALRAHASERLRPQEVPRLWNFVDTFERTSSGKLVRRAT